MSDKNISWYHCGRCGSMFQSPAGELDTRTCTACGRNPSLGFEPPVFAQNASAVMPAEITPPSADREKHPHRRRKRSHFMFKLVAGWLVVLLAIIFGARWLWHDEIKTTKVVTSETPAQADTLELDNALLDEAGPLCTTAFSGFLNSGTPEERNQFVLAPVTTASRMARFYSLNPLTNIDPRTLTLTRSSVLHLPSRRAIETQWHSSDDRLLDAVFIEENGEWRLDWDHFARFSDYPWALFLAGSGEDHGEFRLLARERLADERKNEQDISIVLYAPRFGYSGEAGNQSPEFLVRRNTKNGRLLDAAFKLEREGKRVFGVNLPSINPEGLIRIRAKVRRVEQNLERRFELEDIIACHWYSDDTPGVETPDKPVEK